MASHSQRRNKTGQQKMVGQSPVQMETRAVPVNKRYVQTMQKINRNPEDNENKKRRQYENAFGK